MEQTYTSLIETSELAALLGGDELVVLDCRHKLADPEWGEQQYRESHIPGAHFAHVDRDLSGSITGKNGRHPLPDPELFAAWLGKLAIGPEMQVVAYDQGTALMSGRAWWMLKWMGHDAVAVLNGGFARWVEEGRPVTNEPPRTGKPRQFQPRISMRIEDAACVLRHLQQPDMTLIDARGRDRFRGENESIDPVAGHIPGALNRPYTDNLDVDGRFKPAAQLREDFQQLLAGRDPATVVHQCGSGVSACHNILAMTLAGMDTSLTLYPGSWSEWCSDPSRPVATGP